MQENTNAETLEIPLLPYYVYVLRDPRSDQIFYVGKGTGGRINAHELESMRDPNSEGGSKKMAQIAAIRKEDKDVVIGRVVARFETEKEAFAAESVLIHWVYGFPRDYVESTLTNLQPGHGGSDYVRRRGDFDERRNLDVCTVRLNDGSFTRDIAARNKVFGIERKLDALKDYLRSVKPEWSITDAVPLRPKDPCIYVNVSDVARIQILLRATSTESVILNVRSISNSSVDKANFCSFFASINHHDVLSSTGLKNPKSDPYFKLAGAEKPIRYQDYQEIYIKVHLCMELLQSQRLDVYQVMTNNAAT
jgi:hypothetical protein